MAEKIPDRGKREELITDWDWKIPLWKCRALIRDTALIAAAMYTGDILLQLQALRLLRRRRASLPWRSRYVPVEAGRCIQFDGFKWEFCFFFPGIAAIFFPCRFSCRSLASFHCICSSVCGVFLNFLLFYVGSRRSFFTHCCELYWPY